jgi:hypothetical protein
MVSLVRMLNPGYQVAKSSTVDFHSSIARFESVFECERPDANEDLRRLVRISARWNPLGPVNQVLLRLYGTLISVSSIVASISSFDCVAPVKWVVSTSSKARRSSST